MINENTAPHPVTRDALLHSFPLPFCLSSLTPPPHPTPNRAGDTEVGRGQTRVSVMAGVGVSRDEMVECVPLG